VPDRTTTELGESVLDAVGVAFSRLRRRTMQVEVDPAVTSKDLTRNLVINLVDESDGMLTVGDVGHQLGVSPSVASRMVSDCIDAGLVLRVASQRDGRRSTLSLTPEGESRREIFRQQYRQAFEQITIDWPRSEQLEFARLLLKYADATSALPQAMTRSVPSRTSHAGPIDDARTSDPPHGGRDNQSHRPRRRTAP